MLTGAKHIKQVAQQYGASNYSMLKGLIADGVKRGELRSVDAELTPISLMGMVVIFQFLRPIISVALGKTQYDKAFVDRVAAHTIDLFLNGALEDKKATSLNENAGRRKLTQKRRPQV